MPTASAAGAALGVAVQVYANAVRVVERGGPKLRGWVAARLFACVALLPCRGSRAGCRRTRREPHAGRSLLAKRLHTAFTHDPLFSPSLLQIRKLPALHQPWLHVAWALGGASAATALVEWTDKASAEVEADVARRAAAVRAAGRG